MADIAWVNGRLLDPGEAAVSVLDQGFLYGEGLFETMRAYGGRVFRLAQHLERLSAGAADIGLAPPAAELLRGAIDEALAAGGMRDAVVRLTVTPGLAAKPDRPTVVVLVRGLKLPPPAQYASGCAAICVPAAQVRGTALRRVKSLNYLDKLLAQRAAAAAGAHEAILVDPDGYVVEGAMRNVFAVVDGVLVTPPLTRGLLPGITRQAVLEATEGLGVLSEERDLSRAELCSAEECFLTSSMAEILPIASVDGNAIGARAPGAITRALTDAYRSLVAAELGLAGPGNRSG